MAGIALGTMMPTSCVEIYVENPIEERKQDTQEQKRGDDVAQDTLNHHNTTYIFGYNNLSQILPPDNVIKSLDSLDVDTVFLKCDGNSWGGTSLSRICSRCIFAVTNQLTDKQAAKVRGAGVLHNITITSDAMVQDSIKLANMGFEFGKIYYLNYTR